MEAKGINYKPQIIWFNLQLFYADYQIKVPPKLDTKLDHAHKDVRVRQTLTPKSNSTDFCAALHAHVRSCAQAQVACVLFIHITRVGYVRERALACAGWRLYGKQA